MSKRRMTAKDRKLAIVKAALPLFARKGFAETTTRDLARAAGVSEPLLYKHFPSKEVLYSEIQDYSCQATDSIAQKLSELKPSASTLVHLVYFLTHAIVLGRPAGVIDWDTRHRLMFKSYLDDGVFARVAHENCLGGFCSQMEACLAAATAAGDAVPSPASKHNRAYFAHHIAALLALVHLPAKPPLDYKVSRSELVSQAVWFTLRGMGLTDKAIATYYNPKALALSFGEV
jgi:TetR/AcrR family transcriptional regulator, transcriptional repressor of aconitase